MGNRAVITTSLNVDVRNSKDIGVYLHWNGGRDSVEAFLKYCKFKGYSPPERDNYGWARLCQVAANYFDDGLNVGIDTCNHLDCNNYDNGVYIIKDWEIIGRKYFDGCEQDVHSLLEMLIEIDAAQPLKTQLGKEHIAEKLRREVN